MGGGGTFRKSTRSGDAAVDVARSDEQLARRAQGSATFRSVGAALRWYFEARDRMGGAQGMHPRSERGPDGERHIVSVDGGKGGDLDEVLATVATIGGALERLQGRYPRAFEVLVARFRDGKTYRDLEGPLKSSCASLSADNGQGEAFLLACLDGLVT